MKKIALKLENYARKNLGIKGKKLREYLEEVDRISNLYSEEELIILPLKNKKRGRPKKK